MEAVLLQYSSPDQPISPYKSHIRTPKKGINRSLISRPSENFVPSSLLHSHSGIIQTPPPPYLYHSYPPYPVQQQQPPLLPLPISKPQTINIPCRVRGLSCPPTNRKPNNSNRTRDSSSLTLRKSKPQATISSKKKEKLNPVTAVAKVSPPKEGVVISPSKPLGPDPKDLPKNVSKILTLSSLSRSNTIDANSFSSLKAFLKDEVDDEFSGSVALTTISPPPSSLPLPTFSLRPKLSCNAQAAGVDAGATDDLRRLLRLR